ncbi:hypothetical protein RF11_11593 [Thelohanellus kitauei]|uniref:Uncharacterized protein n=1 Tax=Thelohanellus kitauei TaxID=669202 RepID=A0A0C2MKM6_THEKT|nr:hypothetical protein RF11_11593 [Thelohanellus kitauei]
MRRYKALVMSETKLQNTVDTLEDHLFKLSESALAGGIIDATSAVVEALDIDYDKAFEMMDDFDKSVDSLNQIMGTMKIAQPDDEDLMKEYNELLINNALNDLQNLPKIDSDLKQNEVPLSNKDKFIDKN